MLLCSCAGEAACELTFIELQKEQEANTGIIKYYIDIQRHDGRLGN